MGPTLTLVLSPDAEPHVPDGDPAAGELPLYQQAGEGTAAADVRAQSAPSQEQVSPSVLLEFLEMVPGTSLV